MNNNWVGLIVVLVVVLILLKIFNII